VETRKQNRCFNNDATRDDAVLLFFARDTSHVGLPLMTLTIVQILLSLFAGAGLFLMWRRLVASNRSVAWLVTAGFLIRAIAGQIAFWISYLHLPLARSLQLGDGFWIFGLDGMTYFQQAAAAAHSGPLAILSLNPRIASVFYVQSLATAVLLFGAIAATSLLLNIAAYLGCCLIALSFGDPAKHRAVVFAIGVLSLAPSTVMWSIQPMKDTWFIFLVASFFSAARVWQQHLIGKKVSPRALWWTVAMIATLYGISGIRWYFGFVAAMACLPFFVLLIVQTSRRAVVAAAVAGLVPLLVVAVVLGSGPYISPIMRALRRAQGAPVIRLSRGLFNYVDDSRAGFDSMGGGTMIGAGHAISAVDARLGNKETRVSATSFDPGAATKAPPHHPPAAGTPKPAPPSPLLPAVTSTPAPRPADNKPVPVAHPSAAAPIVAIVPSPRVIATRPVIAAPPLVAPMRNAPVKSIEVEGGGVSGTVAMPASHAARGLAGAAAMILPRTIAQWLGILDVRGGRGLWVFVEIDTIVFDVVLIFCVVSIIGALHRRELRSPVFWLILIVTIVMGGLIAYTVSNFGTLFRHREMVLLGLVLLPLALLPAKTTGAPVYENAATGAVPNAVQGA
jgi:hypothetical protein